MKKKIYEEQFQKSASQLYFKNIIFYLSQMKKKTWWTISKSASQLGPLLQKHQFLI